MTTYTPEYRRETADYIISTGRPVRQVAEELGINCKTANNCVVARKKQLSGEAPTTEVDADLVAAQKRIRELEMENAFLKKSRSLLRERPSVNDKYRLMYAEKENFPVKLMARILEVRLSVGRTGSCHDNAVAESFFANLKNEMYHRQKFSARVEARRALVNYIETYYNRRRPHSTIDYQIPAQAMQSFMQRCDKAFGIDDKDLQVAA